MLLAKSDNPETPMTAVELEISTRLSIVKLRQYDVTCISCVRSITHVERDEVVQIGLGD
jgi:hypothetical protein